MTSALEKVGLKAAGNEEYDAAALDMTAQLQSLKNAGATAIALDAYGAPLGYVLQSLERLGWDVPLIGNTSVSATNLIANDPPAGVLGTPQVKNLVTQVFTSTVFDPNNALVTTMVDTMASLGSIPSTLILADNYDAFPSSRRQRRRSAVRPIRRSSPKHWKPQRSRRMPRPHSSRATTSAPTTTARTRIPVS
ncbi:hypothetical protein GCM10020255_057970 [Rhodococcus baikonurensis]